MSPIADVLIIGGGIAGITTALAAEALGLEVTLLDSVRPGAASRAAAGMLAPSVEELPGDMLAAAIAARDAFPQYLEKLHELSGMHVSLDRTGILQLATPDDAHRLRDAAPASASWLDERALREHEPAFAGHAGALFHPHDGAVDNIALMDALDVAVQRTPRIHRLVADVLSIDAQKPSALTRTRDRISAERIVLATGAWAGALAGLPRQFPVRPVRGQLLRLSAAPIRHVTYGAGGYLVPRGETLLVGSTSEEAGFENETSLAGLAHLRNVAARAIPSLAHAVVVDHWAGLRPMSLDTHPILGADPSAPGLIYACGYSRNGILFAPWAAAQLAELLAGRTPDSLTPFSVDRPTLDPRSIP